MADEPLSVGLMLMQLLREAVQATEMTMTIAHVVLAAVQVFRKWRTQVVLSVLGSPIIIRKEPVVPIVEVTPVISTTDAPLAMFQDINELAVLV